MKLVKNITDSITKENIRMVIRIMNNDYILSQNEEEIKDNYYIELLRIQGIINYRKQREIYKHLISSFNEQSIETKEAICKFCATNNNSEIASIIIPYYISNGMSSQEAYLQYLHNRSIDIIKAANDCTTYAKSPKLIELLILYMPVTEVERFAIETTDLIDVYSKFAIFGTNYGNSVNGLMDFIESTGNYTTTGLVSYTLNQGMAYFNLINALKDILIEGNI